MKAIDLPGVREQDATPFHEGEIAIQERMGERDIETWAKKAIRPFMPDQHRTFFAAQPFLIVSARDRSGRPWATLLEGEAGFISSPDPESLEINAKPVSGDALEHAFDVAADIGILGIEMATRRRNRVNGRVGGSGASGIRFEVGQSFGNCPQYIRERDYWFTSEPVAGTAKSGRQLTESQIEWIRAADTFFIASGHNGARDHVANGMDVSHRGGDRGFVEVLSDTQIRFPDYAGNRHYNTLGNILLDGRSGFLFLDFSTGSLLQITGRATIDFGSEEVVRFPGARQLVSLEIDEIVELSSALRLRWQEDAWSARSLRLVEKTAESADVSSFVFEARDGGPLASFKAGQHLPIELRVPDADTKVQRTYSLSGSPLEDRYRISVKREARGLASGFLHDRLEVGTILESRKPAGDFVLSDGDGPLVLVSAGIGVTPMLSMLHQLAAEKSERDVLFVHGARDGDHHPFRDEAARLAEAAANIKTRILYSRPSPNDEQGRDYDETGRISADFLIRLMPDPDADFYLCGPAGFLAELKDDLENKGVAEGKIHFETF